MQGRHPQHHQVDADSWQLVALRALDVQQLPQLAVGAHCRTVLQNNNAMRSSESNSRNTLYIH